MDEVQQPANESYYPENNYVQTLPNPNPLGWTKDTLNQIINRRDPAQDIMDSLKGIRRDPLTGKVIFDTILQKDPKDGQIKEYIIPPKPLMNNDGLEAFSALLKSTLSQNTILTDFDENHINDHCMSICEAAIFDLENNYKKYGIADTSQMDRIVTIIMVSVHAALRSSLKGFTMNHVTGMYSKVERSQEREKQPSVFGLGSVGGK